MGLKSGGPAGGADEVDASGILVSVDDPREGGEANLAADVGWSREGLEFDGGECTSESGEE